MADEDPRHLHENGLLPGDEDFVMPEPEQPHETEAEARAEEVVAAAGEDEGAEAQVESAGGKVRYSHRQLQRARELLARLYGARRAERFYPLDHPAAREAVGALADVIVAYHGEGVDVSLAFHEGEILLGEQLLPEESTTFDQLVRDMTSIGAGSLVVRRGVNREELERLLTLLGSTAADVDAAGGIEAMAVASGLEHIQVSTVRAIERVRAETGEPEEAARASFGGAVSFLREVDRLLKANQQVAAGKVKGVVRSLVDNVLTNRYAMLQLTGLKNYDEYTYYHSANVAILSLALGSSISQDYRFLSSLGVGALLHDIGKLAVEQRILNKAGALTPQEWAIVRRHPISGAQMVSALPAVDKGAVVTILEHHMRYDGSGYPARTPRRPQHLSSRIVAVADSYDAMTSRRSYSAARVQDEAMALLAKSAGTALDPVLVRLFIRLLGVYPPRSVVRLSSGEIAVVVTPNEGEPLRPVVRVIASEGGEMMDPVDIDLSSERDKSVQGCIDPRLVNIEVDDYV